MPVTSVYWAIHHFFEWLVRTQLACDLYLFLFSIIPKGLQFKSAATWRFLRDRLTRFSGRDSTATCSLPRKRLHRSVPLHRRDLVARVRLLQHRETALLSKINYLHSEIWREREARFVVEKCYSEKLRQNELEIDFVEEECDKLKAQVRALQDRTTSNESQVERQSCQSGGDGLMCINSPLLLPYGAISTEVANSNTEAFPLFADLAAFPDEGVASDTASAEDDEALDASSASFLAELTKSDPYLSTLCFNDASEPLPPYIIGLISRLVDSFTSECPTCTILIDLDDATAKHDLSVEQMLRIITFSLLLYFERKSLLEMSPNKAVDLLVQNYMHLFANFLESPPQQTAILEAIALFMTHKLSRSRAMLRVIMSFYTAEILDPEIILKWWISALPTLFASASDSPGKLEIAKLVEESVGPLVEYLEQRMADDSDVESISLSASDDNSEEDAESDTDSVDEFSYTQGSNSDAQGFLQDYKESLLESVGLCSQSYSLQHRQHLKSASRRASSVLLNVNLKLSDSQMSDGISSVSSHSSVQAKTGSDLEPIPIMSSSFVPCKQFQDSSSFSSSSSSFLTSNNHAVDSGVCKRVTFFVGP